jgi:guanylate kinase
MPLTLVRSSRTILIESQSLFSSLHHRSTSTTPSSTRPYNHPTTPTLTTTMPPIDTSAVSRNRAIVISGPSGSGKSTILKRLFAEYPDKFGFSVSHTTRSPRPGECDGVDYNYVTKEAFQELVQQKGFIEHATFGDNSYGTSIKAVEDVAEKGRTCILDIEMEGVKQVANHPTFPRPRFLFLQPPSMEVLEQRLRSRATDKEEAIVKRLKQAEKEMRFAESGEAPHDKVVVNDDLDRAYGEVKEWIVGGEA